MTGRAVTTVLLVAMMAVTAGCKSLPRAIPAEATDTPAELAFAQRQTDAAAIGSWTLRGRSAFAADGDGWSGAVHWRQTGTEMDLRFIAPLGAGTVRISGTPGMMHIQGSDGTDILSSDPAADLALHMGVSVPVEAMRWWVLGVPVPGLGLSHVELDAAGRAVRIEQAGWSVTYPRYSEYGGRILPGIVVAEDGTTRVRLIVDRMETDPEAP